MTLFLSCVSFQFKFDHFHYFPRRKYASTITSESNLHSIQTNEFKSQKEYIQFLKSESALPSGFSIGMTRFSFRPDELDKELPMNLTAILLDKPSSSFAALFTSNACPGGTVLIGKERMKNSKEIQAIVVNNKISNVCPGGILDGGVSDSERLCKAVSKQFNLNDHTKVCQYDIISALVSDSNGILGFS